MGITSWYEANVMPRLITCACSQGQVMKRRSAVVPLARGDVFELGCGGGLNQRFYDPARISSYAGVDPSAKGLTGLSFGANLTWAVTPLTTLRITLAAALAAVLLWWGMPLAAGPRHTGSAPAARLWGNRRAWLLALYFGLVNCGYMSMVAWLPAYYQQLGWGVLPSGSRHFASRPLGSSLSTNSAARRGVQPRASRMWPWPLPTRWRALPSDASTCSA